MHYETQDDSFRSTNPVLLFYTCPMLPTVCTATNMRSTTYRLHASEYISKRKRKRDLLSHVLGQLLRLLDYLLERERRKRPTTELGEL